MRFNQHTKQRPISQFSELTNSFQAAKLDYFYNNRKLTRECVA